jgi:hypothetical protein
MRRAPYAAKRFWRRDGRTILERSRRMTTLLEIRLQAFARSRVAVRLFISGFFMRRTLFARLLRRQWSSQQITHADTQEERCADVSLLSFLYSFV